MSEKINNTVIELEKKRALEIIYYITKTRTQHIGLVPTFEQLTDSYLKTNRKAIKLFLKLDEKILQKAKRVIKKFRLI